MKRYMLLPEDTIELLPQDGEAESAVSVFCERTLILFPSAKLNRFRCCETSARIGESRRIASASAHATRCLMRRRRSLCPSIGRGLKNSVQNSQR